MQAAEAATDDPLDADIAFHVAILLASGNPFYRAVPRCGGDRAAHLDPLHQPDPGRSASVADHRAVHDAILARDSAAARAAMRTLITDVLDLIEQVESGAS